MTRTSLRSILTPVSLLRLALPWAAVVVMLYVAPGITHRTPLAVVIALLVAVVAVIVVAAFGVVHEAEKIAHRTGDPYGTLVLTLSVVLIEVVLIAAVMLGPGEHATIARDSVSAVMMIILNLVIGACLIVGSRGGRQIPPHNRAGTSAYLAMIATLVVVAFVLPATLGSGGAYAAAPAVVLILLTIALYAWFLVRQMSTQAADYREVDAPRAASAPRRPVRPHLRELGVRTALLIATLVPIVLLSHDLAGFLDITLRGIGAPAALSGLVIAIIVFTPETITALRAARGGETQRVVNLNLGAFVSTVGLTIPAVLAIGLFTGQQVRLAESPAMLAVILATVALSAITWLSPRPTATHGGVHLALFGIYVLVLLTP